MIPRGVYTPLGIMVRPLDQHTTHVMIPRGVYTPLGIIAGPLRPVWDSHDDS